MFWIPFIFWFFSVVKYRQKYWGNARETKTQKSNKTFWFGFFCFLICSNLCKICGMTFCLSSVLWAASEEDRAGGGGERGGPEIVDNHDDELWIIIHGNRIKRHCSILTIFYELNLSVAPQWLGWREGKSGRGS